MTTHSLKRRRPVTACRECHRRKQKCNREKPACNICLARNIPEGCIYEDEPEPVRHKPKFDQDSDSHDTRSIQQLQPEPELSSAEIGLDERIGYAKRNSDNTYAELQKSLKAPNINGFTVSAMRASVLRASFRDRYLEIVAQIPSEAVCRDLYETYFNEADWYYHALDRHHFVAQFASWVQHDLVSSKNKDFQSLSRDLHYFPALLFQLLAVALQFPRLQSYAVNKLCLKSFAECDRRSELFSRLALEIVTLLGRHNPAITSVEYDLMRTTWLKNCSRGSESWHTVGNAIRSAQELGLHLHSDVRQSDDQDVAENLSQVWQDQYRRRLWARLFLLDSHMALVLGRPRHINRDDCTVLPPIDCDFPAPPFKVFPIPTIAHERPSSGAWLLFLYNVALLIHDMLSCGANKPHIRDYTQVTRLDREIRSLLENLSPALRPQNPDKSWDELSYHLPKLRQQIVSTANSYIMKLHRAHMAAHMESREAATLAALAVLESQQAMFELLPEHQYKIYAFSFYTIDAGMFISARTIDYPPEESELLRRIRHALHQAITRLEALDTKSAVANLGAKTLRQGYQQIHEIAQNMLRKHVSVVNEESFNFELPPYGDEKYDPLDATSMKLQTMPNFFDAGMASSMYDQSLMTNPDMFTLGTEQDYFLFNLGQTLSANVDSVNLDQEWNNV